MGRKPKPTNLKLIDGNPGKRPLNGKEPKPKPVKPTCPTWLNVDAKKMWKCLEKELEKLGLLTNIDGQAFSAACQSYGIWVECERILQEKGRVVSIVRMNKDGNFIGEYEQQRPEVSIGNTALKNFKVFCAEFGLTPSSRSSISISGEGEEADVMRGLLSR